MWVWEEDAVIELELVVLVLVVFVIAVVVVTVVAGVLKSKMYGYLVSQRIRRYTEIVLLAGDLDRVSCPGGAWYVLSLYIYGHSLNHTHRASRGAAAGWLRGFVMNRLPI